MRISIERTGEFSVGWAHSHAHQCGNVGTPILQYHVRIECDHTALNTDGWIIDNNAIPSYFRDKYEHVKDFVACEHIAAVGVNDLFTHCRKSGSNPCFVRVAVTGIPGSWISAEHHQEEVRG